MSRCYPSDDCNVYIEYPPLSYGAPTFRPPLVYEQRHEIYSWGYGTYPGQQYAMWTDWKDGPFLPGTRLRNTKLPIAGQKRLFPIHQAGPAGMEVAAPPEFDLKTWLESTKTGTESAKPGKVGAKGKGKKKGKKINSF